MAKVGNRVKETSATTGTGTLDLAGAPTGFRGFGDEFTSGDSVFYLCVDDVDNPTEYEYGTGTFTSGTPDTLSRDSVEGSSNGGSKVSWVAGCTVISTPTAAALNGGQGFNLAALAQVLSMSSKAINEAKGADIASAATTNIWATDGNTVHVTGTTTITSFGTAPQAGARRKVIFDGALTLTHDALTLVLPGAANITTAAGDIAEVIADTTTKHRVVFQKANGQPVVSSAIAQIVNTETGVTATGTTQIPADNTIPQNTEGDQYMSLSITPTNASSTLIIEVVGLFATSGTSNTFTVALFQDSGADAIAGMCQANYAADATMNFSFRHKMTAGTTFAMTFKVRAGYAAAGTTRFNGSGAIGSLGGVAASSITITEVLP